MCECKTVAEFELNGLDYTLNYTCKSKHLELWAPNGDHIGCIDLSSYEDSKTEADREDLIDLIRGLNDKEIERLRGYADGWRDSDDD